MPPAPSLRCKSDMDGPMCAGEVLGAPDPVKDPAVNLLRRVVLMAGRHNRCRMKAGSRWEQH